MTLRCRPKAHANAEVIVHRISPWDIANFKHMKETKPIQMSANRGVAIVPQSPSAACPVLPFLVFLNSLFLLLARNSLFFERFSLLFQGF